MVKNFVYRFKQYCEENQTRIKGIFYQGEGHITVYGSKEHLVDEDKERNYICKDVSESDLAFVDTRKFGWYSVYLPKLELIFKNTKTCDESIFDIGGDCRTLSQLDCEDVGIPLMISLFSSHPDVLDSAIGLCRQSLTLNHWKNYYETFENKVKAFYKVKDYADVLKDYETALKQLREYGWTNSKNSPDTVDDAWPKVRGRPTTLLDDFAIEVVIHKLTTGANLEDQPFHIDDHHSCYSDDENKKEKLPNYGAVTMLLPGSDQAQDQVSTEISTMRRQWERNGRGIWLPTNVIHRGRRPDDRLERNNYLFEVHSNGTFIADKDGDKGHNCRNVKAFRITLQQLLEIKSRQVDNVKGGGHTQSSNPYLIVAGRQGGKLKD
jgi:tetratricopeptide (TPR) repeat protein